VSARCQVESIDKHAAAGLLAHEIRAAPNDRLRGRAVEYPGGAIRMIVAQVRADDDQRFRSVPELLDDLRDFSGRRIAGDNRHDLGRRRKVLEEGQLHLKAVLKRVRCIRPHHREQRTQPAHCSRIDAHRAERRRERLHGRNREAAKPLPMAGAQQQNPSQCARGRTERAVGLRCDLPGVDIPRVRYNERLWRPRRPMLRGEQSRHGGAELLRIARVK